LNSDDEFEIVEPWHEIPFDRIGKRTQLGQAITLGVKHGWEVKAARTVVETKDRELKNGKIKKGSIDEYFWVGGAKPRHVFLINKFYMTINKKHCTFPELKQFILEN
jgi:hypothetical protein